jgi:N-acetylglucosamine kinase-like BadF-type ATPase
MIADEKGHLVGFGRSGPGNWETVGWDGMRQSIHECVHKALDAAKLTIDQIAGAGFGCAGYDWSEDRAPIAKIIDDLGLNCEYGLVNDAMIGLIAGAQNGWGVVVIAGTGTNARGRDRHGNQGQMTGISSDYGENGGASEIIQRAVQEVAMAWTHRRPETQLSDLFIEATGAKDIEDMLAGLARGRYELTGSVVPKIFELAEAGDTVAQMIIHWAGQELGDMAVGIIHQLALENESFEVVMAGSIFKGSQSLIDSMKQYVLSVAPHAEFVHLTAPPVAGAVLSGMEQLALDTAELRLLLVKAASEHK